MNWLPISPQSSMPGMLGLLPGLGNAFNSGPGFNSLAQVTLPPTNTAPIIVSYLPGASSSSNANMVSHYPTVTKPVENERSNTVFMMILGMLMAKHLND